LDAIEFGNNIVQLDQLMLQYLQVHSLKMKHKHYPEGISPIVKNAIAGVAANKDSSTGGLGGIDHQFIPSLLLQMLMCLGTKGDILPNTTKWNSKFGIKLAFGLGNIGNITEIVYSSGFLVFDFFKSMQRSDYSITQIRDLQQIVKTLQVHMHRLYSLKQRLCNSNKPYRGIKLHIIKHVVDGILLYGVPDVFDMIRYFF
jgi:hypothetical protein